MGGQGTILAGMAIFFACIMVSSGFYFSTRPVRFADAVISNLLSAQDNPRGYLAAAAGTAAAAILLAPSALVFFRRMGAIHRAGSLAGTILYATGLLSAALIGCVAPIRGLDFSVHLVLAYTAFISTQAGVSIYVTIAARKAGKSFRAVTAAEWVVPALLLALNFGPDWTGSTAFCEWGLCATIAAGLWALT